MNAFKDGAVKGVGHVGEQENDGRFVVGVGCSRTDQTKRMRRSKRIASETADTEPSGYFLSLFAGIGSFDEMLVSSGLLCDVLVESDTRIRKAAVGLVRPNSTAKLASDQLTLRRETTVVSACWPCQPLSPEGTGTGMADGNEEDLVLRSDNQLSWKYIVQQFQYHPQLQTLVWENVPRLTAVLGDKCGLEKFLDAMNKDATVYNIAWRKICTTALACDRLGGKALPLARERLIGIATKGDFSPEKALFWDLAGENSTRTRPPKGSKGVCDLEGGLVVNIARDGKVTVGYFNSPVRSCSLFVAFPRTNLQITVNETMFKEVFWDVYPVLEEDLTFMMTPAEDGEERYNYLQRAIGTAVTNVRVGLVNSVPAVLGKFLAQAFHKRHLAPDVPPGLMGNLQSRESLSGSTYPSSGFATRQGVRSVTVPSPRFASIRMASLKETLVHSMATNPMGPDDPDLEKVFRALIGTENVKERDLVLKMARVKNGKMGPFMGARLTTRNVKHLAEKQLRKVRRGASDKYSFSKIKKAYMSRASAKEMLKKDWSARTKKQYEEVEFIHVNPLTLRTMCYCADTRSIRDLPLWEKEVLLVGTWLRLPDPEE